MDPLKFYLWLVAASLLLFALLLIPVVLFRPSPLISITAISLPSIVLLSLFFIPAGKRKAVDEGIIYNDGFVEIYDDYLVIRGFYLGPFGRLKIMLKNIEKLEVFRFKTSCWRLQGTGDFKTWFAQDLKRFEKKKNFILECTLFKGKIGFSVEDFAAVSAIFKDKGLLTET